VNPILSKIETGTIIHSYISFFLAIILVVFIFFVGIKMHFKNAQQLIKLPKK